MNTHHITYIHTHIYMYMYICLYVISAHTCIYCTTHMINIDGLSWYKEDTIMRTNLDRQLPSELRQSHYLCTRRQYCVTCMLHNSASFPGLILAELLLGNTPTVSKPPEPGPERARTGQTILSRLRQAAGPPTIWPSRDWPAPDPGRAGQCFPLIAAPPESRPEGRFPGRRQYCSTWNHVASGVNATCGFSTHRS